MQENMNLFLSDHRKLVGDPTAAYGQEPMLWIAS